MIIKKLAISGDNYKELFVERIGDCLSFTVYDTLSAKVIGIVVNEDELVAVIEGHDELAHE